MYIWQWRQWLMYLILRCNLMCETYAIIQSWTLNWIHLYWFILTTHMCLWIHIIIYSYTYWYLHIQNEHWNFDVLNSCPFLAQLQYLHLHGTPCHSMKIRPHIHVQYTTVIYINLDIQKEVYDSHLIHSYSHQLPSPFPKQSTILIPHHLIIWLDSIRR